jgi:hypothetical protein
MGLKPDAIRIDVCVNRRPNSLWAQALEPSHTGIW